MQRYKTALIACLLLFPLICGAQNLTLHITTSHETCPGNGSLSFSTVGGVPNAPVNYKVYKLPDTTLPVANGTSTTLGGQQAGNYRVIASQTVSGITYTAEQEAEIKNTIIPFNFTVSSTNSMCGNDGTIIVNTTSGTAVSYQLVSGPVTTTPQTSNIFNNVPAGFYSVKATDACGFALVVEFRLFSNAYELEIGATQFPEAALPDCDHIVIENAITHVTNQPILYPIKATITVHPPDGSPDVPYYFNITSGDPDHLKITETIPYYYNTPYYYDITVTDICGREYKLLNNLVDKQLAAGISFNDAGCGKIAIVGINNFSPPYNIRFIEKPAGFNPELLNTQYPEFTEDSASFGDIDNTIPYGTYEITVTDACGHTVTKRETLQPPPNPVLSGLGTNVDCKENLGKLKIDAAPRKILSAILTSTTTGYPVPQDVTGRIDETGILKMESLPPGNYTFTITNDCGYQYPPYTVSVPSYSTTAGAVVLSRPDCTTNSGTIMAGPGLSNIILTSAPAAYPLNLPQDLTANLDDQGSLYLENLAAGNYTFTLSTSCTANIPASTTVIQNNVSHNDIKHTPYCGSFDLQINHTSTTTASVAFWLQKEYGNNTGAWGHPSGNRPMDGIAVNANNALSIPNNATTYSLIYSTGHYRVVKSYRAFSPDVQDGVKNCYEEIHDFVYFNTLQIQGVESLSCSEGPVDVKVNALGVSPLTYTLIRKDNQPYILNNANEAVFKALEPAVYTVKVEDPCGNEDTFTFNVADLPPPVRALNAPDITECDTDGSGTATFKLGDQDSYVLADQDPEVVTITYHKTLNDATQRINALPQSITSAPATIFVRAEHNNNPNTCFDISSFRVIVHAKIILAMADTYNGCEGIPNLISADAGFAAYKWSTGETTQNIHPEHAGEYTVTVTDINNCTGSKTVVLSTTAAPAIERLEISDWTQNNNIITVHLAPTNASDEEAEFSIDGINWQDNNIFYGLPTGKYSVYARDKRGCGNPNPYIQYLLTYPKFFTPNGDNINDTWRIMFSNIAEPSLMVYIYDRYGKLITSFDTRSEGWDGKLNGHDLPGTDYWFVVHRQNGTEHTGHFALIR